jgi:hypothetical protein
LDVGLWWDERQQAHGPQHLVGAPRGITTSKGACDNVNRLDALVRVNHEDDFDPAIMTILRLAATDLTGATRVGAKDTSRKTVGPLCWRGLIRSCQPMVRWARGHSPDARNSPVAGRPGLWPLRRR